VFGCADPKSGAVVSLYRLADDPRLNHRLLVEGGLMADEGARLLQEFFEQRRNTVDREKATDQSRPRSDEAEE
jgi:tRNA(adenine34) deaminase